MSRYFSHRYFISCEIEHVDVWSTVGQLKYRTRKLGFCFFGLILMFCKDPRIEYIHVRYKIRTVLALELECSLTALQPYHLSQLDFQGAEGLRGWNAG